MADPVAGPRVPSPAPATRTNPVRDASAEAGRAIIEVGLNETASSRRTRTCRTEPTRSRPLRSRAVARDELVHFHARHDDGARRGRTPGCIGRRWNRSQLSPASSAIDVPRRAWPRAERYPHLWSLATTRRAPRSSWRDRHWVAQRVLVGCRRPALRAPRHAARHHQWRSTRPTSSSGSWPRPRRRGCTHRSGSST